MRHSRSEVLPEDLKSTSSPVNWDLEITKSMLVEKIQKLKRFCLCELNQFIDNLSDTPLLGKFKDFLRLIDEARTYRILEHHVLRLLEYIDGVFENLIARGEQAVPDFNLALPRSLNLPVLRTSINACFIEEILPLFVSEYALAPMMGSRF